MTWNAFDLLPKGERGNIIITSQNEQSWSLFETEERISVDTMSRLESRSLLSWHICHSHQRKGQYTADLCDEVAECLGYLPLAVDLAGIYMRNETNPHSALSRYLNDFRKHQDQLLRCSEYNGLSSYDKTIWTVWNTTLEKIEKRYSGRHSKLLLVFLAHFSGRFVQEELFRLASLGFFFIEQNILKENADFPKWLKSLLAVDGEEWDSFHYRRALDPLVQYGLLRQVKPAKNEQEWLGVRMHNLVRRRALSGLC